LNPRLTAQEALARLKDGNRRFVAGEMVADRRFQHREKNGAIPQQEPIAIVLGCSDARVPAEMVFDQGLGDLFVIRVAGNVVAPSQIASVEFAASQFGTSLVVVLGHTQCGAVLATIDEMRRIEADRSHSLRSIVDRVRPAVEGLMLSGVFADDPAALVTNAVRANIAASVRQLRDGSEGIRELAASGNLQIVGAEYALDTGVVRFFDSD
jgi:carbonic anhydrase